MARMKSAAPARKVIGSALAAAITTVVIWVLNGFVLPDGNTVPVEVAGAITTIVTFLAGYLLPPSPRDQIVGSAAKSEVVPAAGMSS